ncbi:CDP-glycerol glycerophosphotransferase family protein [Streptomyces sp. NPDC091272]|uniref:CDP-glycerol glycerophosphotransferase family protein n=1 Tax=Streptomyces sp. NPDC091272 TaxID=3365981 RepID=UPI00382E427D
MALSSPSPSPDSPPTTVPDISVVVIVYNDADRLPTAVQSVLDQTLHNVEVIVADDCSTDGSYEVAKKLSAAHPDRVRAIQLEENSGGCGEPRNQGIAVARGRYVMFLDSDDTLELNACRNMLEAAETTGADLVSGMCLRVHVDSRHGKTTEWYRWLYNSTRTIDSVAELPDLLVFDTLSTNKCYRREFLIESNLAFPKRIHYEDLLFSAQAYLAASRITLIPNTVYYWNVVEKTEKKSISNRRNEINNFADRVEIHRRIDKILKSRSMDDLKLHKDSKFLKHDLVLYLRELPFLDDAYRHAFAEMARSYVQGFAPEAYSELHPAHAICAYLLLQEDWDNLMPAIDMLLNRNKLAVPLVEKDGRIYWCEEHLEDPHARALLDVTDLGYHTRRVERLDLRNSLTGYDERSTEVVLGGAIVNPLDKIKPESKLSAEIVLKARRTSLQTFRFPVRSVRLDGDRVRWEASLPLAKELRPLGIVDDVWNVRLHLTVDGRTTVSAVTVGAADIERTGIVQVRPRLTRLAGDRIEAEVSGRGHLAFHLVQHSAASQKARALIRDNMDSLPARFAKKTYRKARDVRKDLNSGARKIDGYHRMVKALPIRKGTVVFESHLGKQYSDSPRAIYEELKRRGTPIHAIWSYAGARPTGFPDDVELVQRWSWKYLRALAQAEFWIDNQGFPLKLRKRPETTYIQTWHGSALKRMGFDEPGYRLMSEGEQATYQASLDRFDHFVVRTEHDVRTLARAYRMPESKLLRTGYPRNDALVNGRDATVESPQVKEVKERLGIRADLPVVLYAPTFRANAQGKVRKFEFPFDIEKFAEHFGDKFTLLVRTHYLNQVSLPPAMAGRVVNVSEEPDITPLLLAADVLITDYSSVMFDYALLQRPMIFFAYDWEEYSQDIRGTYFNLLETAPGPVPRDEESLYGVLEDLDGVRTQYGPQVKEFVDKFGEYDHGDAAARIVDRFFAGRGRAK